MDGNRFRSEADRLDRYRAETHAGGPQTMASAMRYCSACGRNRVLRGGSKPKGKAWRCASCK